MSKASRNFRKSRGLVSFGNGAVQIGETTRKQKSHWQKALALKFRIQRRTGSQGYSRSSESIDVFEGKKRDRSSHFEIRVAENQRQAELKRRTFASITDYPFDTGEICFEQGIFIRERKYGSWIQSIFPIRIIGCLFHTFFRMQHTFPSQACSIFWDRGFNYSLRILVVTSLLIWAWQWYVSFRGPGNTFLISSIGRHCFRDSWNTFFGLFSWLHLSEPDRNLRGTGVRLSRRGWPPRLCLYHYLKSC